MAKKDKPQPSLIRIILFLAIVAGLIYWLSDQIESETKIDQRLINQPQVKEIEQVLGKTEGLIRKTKLADEIERIVSQAVKEMDGFPEKQKKELQKEIINQIYQSLMESIEDDQNKE